MQLLEDDDDQDNDQQIKPGEGIALSMLGQQQVFREEQDNEVEDQKEPSEEKFEEKQLEVRDRLYSTDIFAEIDE